jgi:xylan 1,4-beta-xylosidase
MSQVINLIKDNNLDGLKELLSRKPKSILDLDEHGVEASYHAARTGNLEILQYIVEYSVASFNTHDNLGRNCLYYAVESGNLEIVKYLTEKVGLSPLEGDKNLVTPYHIASAANHTEIESYFETIVGSKLCDMYQNPIRIGMYPDPSIIRVEDDYYMVNSSFIFFPCIPVSHSKDLIRWNIIGHAIINPDYAYLEDLEGGRGYWAPDISYYDGRFYITATYRMNDTGVVYRKQMVVSSDKPEGPYCEPAFINEDGIDPSIFTDDDGKRYMLLNRGARIFEISKDGTKQLEKPRLLYYGDNKRAPEGPHLLKKNGWYYLFLAEGGTGIGHQISVARSKSLFGNYEPCPYNPIMAQRNSDAILQCCGHGKPVMTSNGDWYMVYLCYRYLDGKYGMLGRETALDPITWTMDGWPLVNNLKGPSTLQKKPIVPFKLEDKVEESFFDDFTHKELNLNWFTPRSWEKNGIWIENSHLFIKGSVEDLSEFGASSLVLQRQRHFSFEVIIKMKYPKLYGNQNLGLTCYYDENTYLKYGLFKNNNGYELQVHEKIGEEEKISLREFIKEDEYIYLKIITKGLNREFSYSYNNKSWVTLGSLENVYYICSEGIVKGKRFTGATVGMYVYSGIEAVIYGEFDFFVYHTML